MTERRNQSATVVTPGYKRYRDCLKLEGRSLLCTLVSVMHPDLLIRLNFRLRWSDNLHKDSHQNSGISMSKNDFNGEKT